MATFLKVLLRDLDIIDIKKELEKRNLERTGVKSVLADRLKKAVISEGKDPDIFRFDVETSVVKEADEVDDQATEKTDEVNGTSVGGAQDSENLEWRQISTVSHFGEIGSNDAVQGNIQGEGEENASQGKRIANADRSSAAKSNTGISKLTTPAKGKKSQSSVECEEGDESFVVQEDDVVLNDIDSDLLDGEGKAPNSGSAGEAGDINGDANNGDLASTATTDASANLLENAHSGQTAAGSKDGKDTSEAKSSAQPVKKDEKTAQTGRNIWVSGLSSNVRATDLKTLFNKHGKVVAAKVVTNARASGSQCFGLVTMSSADDATKCIQQLHQTVFHGRKISIERAQTETQGTKEKILPPSGLISAAKPVANPTPKSETKPLATKKDNDTPGDTDKGRDEAKIKADEVRDRLRRKEQFLEREKFKQRMVERKQREEAHKIERERMRLREMREELERQRIETERRRLETERLRMEKEQEHFRKQQRMMQERRALKRRAPREEEWPNKHPAAERFHGAESRYEPREFTRRAEEPRKFKEERPPQRDGRLAREERPFRDNNRGIARHDSRSDWKSERGTWDVPNDHSNVDGGWGTGNDGDGWNSGVSQPSGNYGLRQGQNSNNMRTGTVFVSQPAVQTGSGMMQSNMNRQTNGRYGMGTTFVRRY